MSFEDNLQLALDPAASEQLPRELQLGVREYAWTNGKFEMKQLPPGLHRTPGFRELRADELRQLMRRLQAAPQHHVILLNLMGHDIDGDMMRELAEPIAALKALQVLILGSKSRPGPSPLLRVFVLWRQVHFHCIFTRCREQHRRVWLHSGCGSSTAPAGA